MFSGFELYSRWVPLAIFLMAWVSGFAFGTVGGGGGEKKLR